MKSERIAALLMKPEGVRNVDSVPTPALNAIQLEERLWSTITIDWMERNKRENATGYGLGHGAGTQPSGRFLKFTINVALKGSGAAAEVPEIDVPLRCAGFKRQEGVPGVGKRTWSLLNLGEEQETATAYIYAGLELFKVVGLVARLTGMPFLPGKMVTAAFECTGLLREDPVEATPAGLVYPQRAIRPPLVDQAALVLDGFAPRYHSATLDLATEVATLGRGGAPGGHDGYEIVDYKPTLKATIDAPNLAAFDPYTFDKTAELFPWSLSMLRGAQYNRFTIEGDGARVAGVPHEAKDKRATIALPMELCSPDDTPLVSPLRLVQS